MKPQIKPPAVRALDTLALALEEQWVVAGLGPRAVPAEVLSRAIEACKQTKPAPQYIGGAAKVLASGHALINSSNAAPKREANVRVAAVKIYRAEWRKLLRNEKSGGNKNSEKQSRAQTLAWAKTQTQLMGKFRIKAPESWKYEIIFSVEN